MHAGILCGESLAFVLGPDHEGIHGATDVMRCRRRSILPTTQPPTAARRPGRPVASRQARLPGEREELRRKKKEKAEEE